VFRRSLEHGQNFHSCPYIVFERRRFFLLLADLQLFTSTGRFTSFYLVCFIRSGCVPAFLRAQELLILNMPPIEDKAFFCQVGENGTPPGVHLGGKACKHSLNLATMQQRSTEEIQLKLMAAMLGKLFIDIFYEGIWAHFLFNARFFFLFMLLLCFFLICHINTRVLELFSSLMLRWGFLRSSCCCSFFFIFSHGLKSTTIAS
jgi:hypothetical protein